MERLVSELERYVRRINRTNLSATLADGETTLTDALARRDAMTLRYGLLKTLVSTASDRLPRYGRAEIRILPAVEVGPLRRRMDELARQRARARHRHPAGQLGDRSHGRLDGV